MNGNLSTAQYGAMSQAPKFDGPSSSDNQFEGTKSSANGGS